MSKIKILLMGAVGEHFSVLQKKLESLQSGKAGPFDACFCVGELQVPTPLDSFQLPLPVYLQEYSGPLDSVPNNEAQVVALGGNLFYLQGDSKRRSQNTQFLELKLPNQDHELVVGVCSKHVRHESTEQSSKQQCDLLLSSDWPQGMEDVVHVDTEPLSFDVAQIALDCRPRYHIAPSSRNYHQSPPYSLPQSSHVGRFIGLAPVTPGKSTKTTKFVHALGLAPLSANPPPTTAPATLPCPFLSKPDTNTTSVPGFVPNAASLGSSGGYSRFSNTGGKRSRRDLEGDGTNEPISLDLPDDASIHSLFLYGLHKDVTGELQSTKRGRARLLKAFGHYHVNDVRYPPHVDTSTYCFLEFESQKAAHACLLDCQGRITIESVDLTLKWATPNAGKRVRGGEGSSSERHFVTQDEAVNSTTLYFHPPRGQQNSEEFANGLGALLQKTLEDVLNEGNSEEDARITAETEPALKVSVRKKDQYGFLEFASHAAATMALAALTNSTDGGLVSDKPEGDPKPIPSNLVGSTLRWAKGEPPKSARQQVLEALGLERQYYEADTRTDCWFCLASPTCETHLITGVYKEWYATMPKGPVHPGHLLLVPVTHTRQGAWTLPTAEWLGLLDKLQAHANTAYDCDLFVFERAMETKGGYHSHINCVPIPKDTATKLRATMTAHAEACGFNLRPIESDLGIDSLIGKDDSNQYFYAEIRTPRHSHRFLYQHDSNEREARTVVPLQFAREVLASVLENPKLAHWKSCVVDHEHEAKLAGNFRESFSV